MSPNQGPIAEPAEDIFNGNIDNYSDNLDFLTGDAYPEDDADLLEALLPLCEASPSPKKNKNINVYHNHKKICLRRSQSADVGQSKDTGQSADMGAVAISDDELIDQLTAEQTALSTAMAAMFHTTTTTSKTATTTRMATTARTKRRPVRCSPLPWSMTPIENAVKIGLSTHSLLPQKTL